jgi:hypothetical protein
MAGLDPAIELITTEKGYDYLLHCCRSTRLLARPVMARFMRAIQFLTILPALYQRSAP